MDEKLRELKARNAGATHKDAFRSNAFYRQERYETQWTLYDETVKRMEPWRYYGTYPPESAERM